MEIRKPYKYAPIVEKKYKWSAAEKRAIEKALTDAGVDLKVQFHSSGVKSGTITVYRYVKEPSDPEYRIGRRPSGVSSEELSAYQTAKREYNERDQGLKVEIIDALIAAGYSAAQFIEESRSGLTRHDWRSDYRFVRVRPTPASKFVVGSVLDEGDLKFLRLRLINLAADTFRERRRRGGRRITNLAFDDEPVYEIEALSIPTILNEALAALAEWEEIDLSIDEQYRPVFHTEIEDRVKMLDERDHKHNEETEIRVNRFNHGEDKGMWIIAVEYKHSYSREPRAKIKTFDAVEGVDFVREQMQIEGTERRADSYYVQMLEAAYTRKLYEVLVD